MSLLDRMVDSKMAAEFFDGTEVGSYAHAGRSFACAGGVVEVVPRCAEVVVLSDTSGLRFSNYLLMYTYV